VEQAHGHAAEVFSKTSEDAVLPPAAVPADLATAEGARDAVAPGTPPAGQTEPGSDRPDTGSVVSTGGTAPTTGSTDGDRS
jgi:peptide/nickel transport system ATP-binding protein